MVLVLGFIACALIAYGLVVVGGHVVGSIQTKRDVRVKSLEYQVRVLEDAESAASNQVRVAEKGLRLIANGISGNPALDAQITLDDISNIKVLN